MGVWKPHQLMHEKWNRAKKQAAEEIVSSSSCFIVLLLKRLFSAKSEIIMKFMPPVTSEAEHSGDACFKFPSHDGSVVS